MDGSSPYEYSHSISHLPGGVDELSIEDFTGTPARGDILVAMTSSPRWGRYALIIPSAGQRNVLAVDNGEVEPTWQSQFDDGAGPSTLSVPNTAADGTSLGAARADHAHGVNAHNVLSTGHGDSAAQGVTRGSIIIGDSTPAWNELTAPASPSMLESDGTDVFWHNQSWTSVAHNAAHYTASAGTWTVASADLITFKYKLFGKTMVVSIGIDTSDVSATPQLLQVLIPASKTAASTMATGCMTINNTTTGAGMMSVLAGGTVINFRPLPFVNWATAVGTTYVYGTLIFETT